MDWALLALQATNMSHPQLWGYYWFKMRNKSKMPTKIMEFGASSYPIDTSPMMRSLGWLEANLQSFESGCVGSTSTSWTSPYTLIFGFSSSIGESFKIILSMSSPKKLISITFFTKVLDSSNLTCIDSSIVKVDLLKTL